SVSFSQLCVTRRLVLPPCPSSPSVLYQLIRPRPRSTLFPYTTLFRSRGDEERGRREPGCVGADRDAVPTHQPRRGRDQPGGAERSEEHTSELQSRFDLVCRLLLEKKNNHHCSIL